MIFKMKRRAIRSILLKDVFYVMKGVKNKMVKAEYRYTKNILTSFCGALNVPDCSIEVIRTDFASPDGVCIKMCFKRSMKDEDSAILVNVTIDTTIGVLISYNSMALPTMSTHRTGATYFAKKSTSLYRVLHLSQSSKGYVPTTYNGQEVIYMPEMGGDTDVIEKAASEINKCLSEMVALSGYPSKYTFPDKWEDEPKVASCGLLKVQVRRIVD